MCTRVCSSGLGQSLSLSHGHVVCSLALTVTSITTTLVRPPTNAPVTPQDYTGFLNSPAARIHELEVKWGIVSPSSVCEDIASELGEDVWDAEITEETAA
jgi:hypothetical protein